MTSPIDRAYVEILPDFRKFASGVTEDVKKTVTSASKEFGGISRAAETEGKRTEGVLSKSFGGIKETLKSYVGFATTAFAGIFAVEGIKGFIEAGREAQKSAAQTAAVIKSTGGAAHVTADDVENLARKISGYSGVQDDVVKGAENMLLTFTNIRNGVGKNNDIFSQATKTVIDMSVALKEDAKSASIQLGKALNDPIKGVTALQRVGVTFTQQQRDQIKAMVDSGHTMQAQKVILAELNKEFGGSAAAQATAGEKASATWHNLQEQIGTALLPALDKVENWFANTIIPAVSKAVGYIQDHWPAVQRVIVEAWEKYMYPALKALGDFIHDRVIPVVQAIVGYVVEHWPAIEKAFVKVWNAIKPTIEAYFNALHALWVNILMPIVEWVKKHWPEISTMVKIVFGAVILLTIALFKAIQLYFKAITFAVQALNKTFGTIDRAWRDTYQAIVRTGKSIIDWFKALPGVIQRAFSSASTWLSSAGGKIIGGLWGGIQTGWRTVSNFFKNLKRTVTGAIGDASQWLIQQGKNIIGGLWSGIKAVGAQLINDIKSIIPGWIKSALGIHSPPDWAIQFGKFIAQGLAHGISHFPHFLTNLAKTARDKIGALLPNIGGGPLGQLTPAQLQKLAGGGLQPVIQDARLAQAYALRLVTAKWGAGQWNALLNLWNGESGWRWNALNNDSGAYGIPQSLPASKMASAGSDWMTNAATQIRWGLAYIASTYGTPGAAYGKWLSRSPHWYHSGAWNVPTDQLAWLQRGERVTPKAQSYRDGQQTQRQDPARPLTAQDIGTEVARQLEGATLHIDANGLVKIVASHTSVVRTKGNRR